jgi:hypothetical protein
MKWKNPTTPEEATKIIDQMEDIFFVSYDNTKDFLESVAKQLAIFGTCFNHNFTREHRDRIMNILVANANIALEPVLEALADCPRAEQIDFTSLFIRKAYTIRGDIQ